MQFLLIVCLWFVICWMYRFFCCLFAAYLLLICCLFAAYLLLSLLATLLDLLLTAQLKEVRKAMLSKLMCDNGDAMKSIQPWPQYKATTDNNVTSTLIKWVTRRLKSECSKTEQFGFEMKNYKSINWILKRVGLELLEILDSDIWSWMIED